VTKLIIDQSQRRACPTVAQNLDLCHRGLCPNIAESSDLCHVVFANRPIRSTRTAVGSVPRGDTNRTIFVVRYANLPVRLSTRGPISVVDLSHPVIDRWQLPGRESGPPKRSHVEEIGRPDQRRHIEPRGRDRTAISDAHKEATWQRLDGQI